MEEVAYFFTPTREGNTIQELLKNFSGVLVTDFYAAYDAINCRQQKCLIHFIRDLNSAILERPFDKGLKQLAGNFAGVLKPIIETVDRRGLKNDSSANFGIPLIDSIKVSSTMMSVKLQASSSSGCKKIEVRCLLLWISTTSHGTTIMRSTP